MAKQIINIGSAVNDKSGDPLRTAFQKVNANFTELYNTAAADATDRLVNGTAQVVLDEIGMLTIPGTIALPDGIITGNDNTDPGIVLGSSNKSVFVRTLSGVNMNIWKFGTDGELSVPSLFPLTFTAVLDTAHMTPSVALTDAPWTMDVTFSIFEGGLVTEVEQIFPIVGNPGYVSGYSFTFTEADHGIPGYRFDLELQDVVLPGGAGWTANIAVSAPPALPASLTSPQALVLHGDTSVVIANGHGIHEEKFRFDGRNLILPGNGDIRDYLGNSVLGGGTGNFTFTNNNITTDNGQDDIVLSIQGYDASQPTPNLVDFNWRFGANGTLTVPNGIYFEHAYITAEAGDQVFAGNTNTDLHIRTLTNSTLHDWQFGTDGNLTLPGKIKRNGSVAELDLGVIGTDNVLLKTTDDVSETQLLLSALAGASLTTNHNVLVSAGNGPTITYNNYYAQEMVWELVRDQDAQIIAPDTRPWAGMPSYLAYTEIMLYSNPPGVLPPASNMAPTAKSASDAYELWQEEVAATNVSVSVTDKAWTFTSDGQLTVPGAIKSPVTPQVGAFVTNLPDYDQVSDNNYIWVNAGPALVPVSELISRIGDMTGCIFTNNLGVEYTVIQDNSPTGTAGLNLVFDNALPAGYIYTVRSPDYSEKIAPALNVNVDENIWTFGNDGIATFPDDTTIGASSIKFANNSSLGISNAAYDAALASWEFIRGGEITDKINNNLVTAEGWPMVNWHPTGLTASGYLDFLAMARAIQNSNNGTPLIIYPAMSTEFYSQMRSALIAIQNSYNLNSTAVSISSGYGKHWNFSETGKITLPAGGDIVDSTGETVLGFASTSYSLSDVLSTILAGRTTSGVIITGNATGTFPAGTEIQFESLAGGEFTVSSSTYNAGDDTTTVIITDYTGFGPVDADKIYIEYHGVQEIYAGTGIFLGVTDGNSGRVLTIAAGPASVIGVTSSATTTYHVSTSFSPPNGDWNYANWDDLRDIGGFTPNATFYSVLKGLQPGDNVTVNGTDSYVIDHITTGAGAIGYFHIFTTSDSLARFSPVTALTFDIVDIQLAGNTTINSNLIINHNIRLKAGADIVNSAGDSVLVSREPSFEIKTSSFTAQAGRRYGINTTDGAMTGYLPQAPVAGDAIFFVDSHGTFSTNNFTINGNEGAPFAKTIMGQATQVLTVDNDNIGIFYNGTEWRFYA